MEKTAAEAKKSADLIREIMELDFGKQYKEWKGNFSDDRQLFCELYEILMEATSAMETVTNCIIWVAFRKYFRQQEKTLFEIREHFCK